MKRFIFALSYSLCANTNAELLQNDPVLRWTGVEVVTNDFLSVDKIRELTKISPGMNAAMSDPVLPRACQSVRERYPLQKINCQAISMEGGTALYVVEVQPKNDDRYTQTISCNKNNVLSKRLKALNAQTFELLENYLKAPNSIAVKDIINKHNALDSDEPNLSAQFNKNFKELQGHIDSLKKGATSCDSEDRATALQLFNYSGQPALATKIAITLMLDPSSHVRNNATRLLSVFAKFISPKKQMQLINNSCKLINNPSFTDQNKGLALIAALSKEDNWNKAYFPNDCLSTIKEIRRISISEQLGGYAKEILNQFND